MLTLPWWWQSLQVISVPSYLAWNKYWLYPGGGRAQKWSLYLPTGTGTSSDSTLVVAELKSSPCTFPFGLEQVLTLPWLWRSSEVSLYLPTCTWTSADFILVVTERRSGHRTFLLALEQVLTLPWCWQSLEMVPVPSNFSGYALVTLRSTCLGVGGVVREELWLFKGVKLNFKFFFEKLKKKFYPPKRPKMKKWREHCFLELLKRKRLAF